MTIEITAPAVAGPAVAAPATAERLGLRVRRLSVTAGEIAYIDEGSGPPIVLVHGAPLTSLGFVRMIRALRGRFRVIAPDLPGFGQSWAAPGFSFSLAGYAASLEEVCRALQLRSFVLYLNDSSGCLGLHAAARLAPEVAGLVVADTVPLPLTGRAWPVKLLLRHVLGSRLLRWLNRRLNLLPWMVATVAPLFRQFSRPERQALLQEFDTAEKRDRVIDLLAAMGRDEPFMRATAEAARLRLAHVPALLLYGQLDPMRLIGAVSRFRKLFAQSQVAIIPGEEHFPFLGSGERVARTVADWMDTLPPAAAGTAP